MIENEGTTKKNSISAIYKCKKWIITLALPVLSLSTIVSYGNYDSNYSNLYADKDGIKPGKRKAVLILSDGRKVELSACDSLNYSNNSTWVLKNDSIKIAKKKGKAINLK